MATNKILIKRSTTQNTPTELDQGELAYSELSDDLFIGIAGASLEKIGGQSEVALNQTQNGRLDTLETRADTNDSALAQETADRIAADSAQDQAAADAAAAQATRDQQQDDAQTAYQTSNDAALAQEVTDRTNADTALQSALDAEIASTNSEQIAQDARMQQIEDDAAAAGTAQATKDAAQDASLAQEVTDRTNADAALQSALDAEIASTDAEQIAQDGRLDAIEANYVTTNTDQTITGSKTFSTGTTTIENLVVTGTQTSLNSTDLSVQDRVVTYNAGESGAGVTGVTSGFEVDRGTEPTASLVFNESSDAFFVDYGDGTGPKQIATTGDALYTTEADGGIDAAKLAQQVIIVDGTVARNDRDNNFSTTQTFQQNVIGNGTTSEVDGFIIDGGVF